MGAGLRAEDRSSARSSCLSCLAMSVKTRRSIFRLSGPVHLGLNALVDSKGNSLSEFRSDRGQPGYIPDFRVLSA